MKVFFRFFRDYPRESILAPLFKLLEACFDLLVPIVVAQIIDGGIRGGQGDGFIWRRAGVLVLLAVVGLTCTIIAQYFSAKAAVGTATNLRHDLFAHMQAFTYAQTDRVGTAAMITRMTSDINQIQSGINMTLRLTLRSPIIVFGAMIMAFTIDAHLALIFAAAIPLLALVVFGVMLGGIPLYRRVQGKLDGVTAATRENLGGVRVIRAFRKEEQEIEKFGKVNREQTALQDKAGRLSALMNPLTYVLVNLAVVLIIRQSGAPVNAGTLTQGQVVALVNYMAQILVELVKLANTIFLITKGVACGNRVAAVLDMPAGMEILPETGTAEQNAACEGSAAIPAVAFRHVELTYPGGGAPSLTDITFTAMPGQTVGIIGGTGSGKTSLVNLIPRFYEATGGSVRVFGRDVRELDPEAHRHCAAESRAVPRHCPLQPALGHGGRTGGRCQALGGVGDGAGGGFYPGKAGRAGRTGRAEGTQFLRRAEAAPDHCAGAGGSAGHPDSGRQRFGTGFRHRCRSAQGTAGTAGQSDCIHHFPAHLLHPRLRSDTGAGGRSRGGHGHAYGAVGDLPAVPGDP